MASIDDKKRSRRAAALTAGLHPTAGLTMINTGALIACMQGSAGKWFALWLTDLKNTGGGGCVKVCEPVCVLGGGGLSRLQCVGSTVVFNYHQDAQHIKENMAGVKRKVTLNVMLASVPAAILLLHDSFKLVAHPPPPLPPPP